MKSVFSFALVFSCTFIFSLFLSETCLAQASPNWKRINLASTNGVQINVEYQMNSKCIRFEKEGRRDYQARMATTWIDVYIAQPSRNIEVEIQSYKQDMIPRGSGQNPIVRTYDHYDRTVRLQSAIPGRYTGNLGLVATRVTSNSARVEDQILQRVQVRIDGKPLIDPVSRRDSFGISMYDRVPCL